MLEEDQLYPGQATFQVFLLLLALVCVPWMLCTKPYLLWKEHQKITEQGYHGIGANGNDALSNEDESDAEGGGHAVAAGEMDEEHVRLFLGAVLPEYEPNLVRRLQEFDMGEHVIHQVIRALRSSFPKLALWLTVFRSNQTRSSSAWDASPTPRRTSVFGPSRSPMRSSPRSCGR